MLGPATTVEADGMLEESEEEEEGSDVIVGPECVNDGLVGLFCFTVWDLRAGEATKPTLMGLSGGKHLVLTVLQVGVEGARYVGLDGEPALLGDGGGE